MKKFACVTSMHQPYYDHIGKHMISSWQKYWPKDIDLYLYAEKMSVNFDDPRIKKIDWDSVCYNDWSEFAVKTQDSNAHKFGKKGWASLHGWKNIDAEYIIWVDADVLSHKELTLDILEKTLNFNQLVGLFDTLYQFKDGIRETWSAESGYVIINKQHKDFSEFIKKYEEYYRLPSKPDKIVRWWDNEILMLTASHFMDNVHDLSQYRRTSKTQTPLNHCFLGDYISHFKAKSKKHHSQEEFIDFTENGIKPKKK
jgi:hypothetical protein